MVGWFVANELWLVIIPSVDASEIRRENLLSLVVCPTSEKRDDGIGSMIFPKDFSGAASHKENTTTTCPIICRIAARKNRSILRIHATFASHWKNSCVFKLPQRCRCHPTRCSAMRSLHNQRNPLRHGGINLEKGKVPTAPQNELDVCATRRIFLGQGAICVPRILYFL